MADERETIEHGVEVAAGLVFHSRRLLIAQRLRQDHLGGLWEFPGGKRHAEETFEQCLRRELMEELGIEAAVGKLYESITHAYPGKTVHLRFFLCTLKRHQPKAIGCQAFAWVDRDALGRYPFPPADARLLDRLATTPQLWE